MSVCRHAVICNGCDSWSESLETHQGLKLASLQGALSGVGVAPADFAIPIISLGDSQVRDRADLSFRKGMGPGLYAKDHESIVDIEECQLMSSELSLFLKEVSAINWPKWSKASLRLRVYKGKKGIWLDLANEEIKRLLDEGDFLKQLLATNWIIEIGQKRKRLVMTDRLRLMDPLPEEWFSTFQYDAAGVESEIDLKASIGSFTQPSRRSNKVLLKEVFQIFHKLQKSSKLQSILELGSGIGNFTLPLAKEFQVPVLAIENDLLSLQCLQQNLNDHPELKSRVTISKMDFQRGNSTLAELPGPVTALVDPPRSGLMGFVEKINGMQNLKSLVYVSCFQESLARDLEQLKAGGWSLQQTAAVDQFPRSAMFETVSLLIRN